MAYIFRLDQQKDTAITSPSNGQILMHNGTAWTNTNLSSIGLYSLTVTIGALTLDSGTTYNPGSAARTIAHSTAAGYVHLPAAGATSQYIKWASAGTGSWADFAALTTDANKGLTIGGSTTGSYTPTTTKEIAVDFNQVQAKLTNPVTGTGTQWQIAYWSGTSTITGSANFTIDTSGNVTCSQNLTVLGDLTVSGATTTLEVGTLRVEDNMIKVGHGNILNVMDMGIYGTYNDGSQRYTGLYYDSSEGYWQCFKGATTEPGGTTIDSAGPAYAWSGFKADKIMLVTPASGSSSTNYVTWNSTSKELEYRSSTGFGTMSSWGINSADHLTVPQAPYSMVDGNTLAIIGDGAAISTALANGSALTKKITITHSTDAPYKHIPASGASNQYLQYASAGTAQWASFATLTTSAGKGLKIGGSTTGTYDPATTKAIEVDFAQVQAILSGTDNQIAVFSGASTLDSSANFMYDGTTHKMLCGQIWKSTAAITTSQNFGAGEFVMNCTNTPSSITLTFTSAFLASNVGQSYYVKQSGTGGVVIATQGTETINGSTSDYTLPGQYTAVLLHILSATAVIIL